MQSMEDLPAAPSRADAGAARPLPARRPRHATLAVHLLAYGLVLLALMLVGPIGSWTSDDGAYAIESATLDATGAWSLDHPLIASDPEGASFGFVNSERGGDRWYTYAKHPVWVLVLSVFHRLGGDGALFLPTLIGAVGAAAAAWCVAGLGDRRWSIPAFWLVALGPVAAQSTGLWAHAPSAALGGAATFAAVALVRHGFGAARIAGLTAALVAGVLLRSEGLLFAGAVVVALGGFELWTHAGVARVTAALRTTVLPGAAVLLALVAERAFRASIAPGAGSALESRAASPSTGWVEGRFRGAANSLLLAGDQPAPVLLGLAGVALCVVAAVRARRAVGEAEATSSAVLLGLAGLAVLAVRYVCFARQPSAGLAPMWPLALIGLILWRWGSAEPWERVLAVATGLFAAAILATQYPEGGGLEIGGRFFAPVAIPVAVLAVAGLDRFWRARPAAVPARMSSPGWALPAVVVVAGLLVPAGAAAVATESLRSRHAGIVASVADMHADTVITLEPSLGRIAWRTVPETDWVTATDVEDAQGIAGELSRLGDRRVAVFGEGLDGFEADGWRATEVRPWLVVLDRTGG